jgi:hypothetical protein
VILDKFRFLFTKIFSLFSTWREREGRQEVVFGGEGKRGKVRRKGPGRRPSRLSWKPQQLLFFEASQ